MAQLLRATAALDDVHADGAASRCVAQVGATQAVRFQRGRCLVVPAATDPCGARLANREAATSDMRIDDAAYQPALEQVRNKAGIRVAMG